MAILASPSSPTSPTSSSYLQVAGAWNEFLSSMMYMPSVEERRLLPPPTQQQLNKIYNLQLQHQQLQLQQLHLIHQQHKCQDLSQQASAIEGYVQPSPALPALPVSVWQSFQQLQASQWTQAIELVRSSTTGRVSQVSNPQVAAPPGIHHLELDEDAYHRGGGASSGKRCKAYAAPKGVWKNNGGFNATIYVHKRRIYGPIRRELNDAIEDRREMEEALKTLVDAGFGENTQGLEAEMRDVVGRLRGKVRVSGNGYEDVGRLGKRPRLDSHDEENNIINHHHTQSPLMQGSPCLNWGKIEFSDGSNNNAFFLDDFGEGGLVMKQEADAGALNAAWFLNTASDSAFLRHTSGSTQAS